MTGLWFDDNVLLENWSTTMTIRAFLEMLLACDGWGLRIGWFLSWISWSLAEGKRSINGLRSGNPTIVAEAALSTSTWKFHNDKRNCVQFVFHPSALWCLSLAVWDGNSISLHNFQ